jgi:putative ABC transport system permease protein
MPVLAQDFRHAARALFHNRQATLIALVALALGIGVNTAIFSVVHAVLLSPLPYRDPDRLVTLLGEDSNPVSAGDFYAFRDQSHSFSDVAAAEAWSASLTGGETPRQIVGLRVSDDMFAMLGVPPLRGRTFSAADVDAGRDQVVVISHSMWLREFGGLPGIIGRNITLDRAAFEVIGVMPPEFHFTPFWITQAEMWAPLDLSNRKHEHGYSSLRVFARLATGAAMGEAQADMNRVTGLLAAAYPDTNARMHIEVESLTEKSVGRVRPALQLMLGAVGMVLLIACADVANLALARVTARKKEIAIRRSLGAPFWRIVRQFLLESVTLSVVGAGCGVVLAAWGIHAIRAMLQPDAGSFNVRLLRWNEIGLDPPVLLFTVALAIASGVLSGLLPAMTGARGMGDALKDRNASSGGGRLRKVLVAFEIAIALVLLTGAGLLTRSFLRLREVKPGFDPRNVMTMTISLGGRDEYLGAAREQLYRSILERVSAVPGVRRASMTNHLPLAGDLWKLRFEVEGRPIPAPGSEMMTVYRVSRPGYFAVMRTPIREGRDFTDQDDAKSPRVAMINETLRRRLFANENPLGKRITFGDPRKPAWMVIVGVIGDIRQQGWTQPAENEIHVPFAQSQFLTGAQPWVSSMTLVARTDLDAASVGSAIENAVWSIDRNLPLSQVQTLEHAIGNATWEARFSLLVTGIFSGVAVILAMIGIYGVMAYEVAQRTNEIGIRMALGAGSRAILRLIAWRSIPVALGGIAVGLAAAAMLVRIMRTMLYNVDVFDSVTFAAVVAMVLIVAIAAALIPARRAMKVDPMVALRRE